MELFIPVEIFRKKGNTFRGITFFPFLLKRLKFVVPLVWIISAMLQVERKRKNLQVFCKWYNSIPFLFLVPQKIPVIPVRILHFFTSVYKIIIENEQECILKF